MKAVNLFKALSDETRLRLVNLSIHYELNVNEIVRIMGMGQSRISRHLKILSESGLLSSRRDGLWIFYSAVGKNEGADFIEAVRYLFELDEIFRTDLKAARTCVEERSRRTTRFFDDQAQNWEFLKREIIGDVDLDQKIMDALPSLTTLVDLGCGTGDLLPVLRTKADSVIGVEKSASMLAEARKHFEPDRDGIEVRIGELEHLPLRDEEVDAALTSMVLHHLPDPRKAFIEAHRVLKQDGLFLIIDLLPHTVEGMRERYGDVWLGFSPSVMEQWLLESGFSSERMDRFDLKNGLEAFLILSKKTS